MESLPRLLEPFAAYPRWLVVTCLVLAAIAGGWLLIKLAKWALAIVVTVVLVLLVLVAVVWLLG